ncbi:hypothetical protein EMCRGX_G024372 [Ephydatia muelleri]
MKSLVTMEITDGKRTKVVHVNRLQPRIHPSVEEDVNSGVQHTQRVEPLHNVQWEAPLVEHFDFGSQPPVANPPTLPPQPVQPEPPPPLPTLPPQEQPGTIEQTTRSIVAYGCLKDWRASSNRLTKGPANSLLSHVFHLLYDNLSLTYAMNHWMVRHMGHHSCSRITG